MEPLQVGRACSNTSRDFYKFDDFKVICDTRMCLPRRIPTPAMLMKFLTTETTESWSPCYGFPKSLGIEYVKRYGGRIDEAPYCENGAWWNIYFDDFNELATFLYERKHKLFRFPEFTGKES